MVQFQRDEVTNDNAIQSYNFGGLNTTANRLAVPYTDATELLNTNVGINGALIKRNGSRLLGTTAGYGISFRSVLGYSYSVTADNTTLRIISRDNNQYTTLRTFNDVYTSSPNPASTQWVQLPDIYSRILALRADRPPVEAYTIELRVPTFSVTTPSTLLTLPNPNRFGGDNPSPSGTFSDVVYLTVNGVQTRYVNLPYTNSSGTITLTLPITLQVGDQVTYDVVGFRWCWWAESIKWLGDRFYDAFSRFNVTTTDNNVAIAEKFRSDLIIGEEQLIAAFSSTADSTGLYTNVTQPTTATQYVLSDGAVYVAGTGQYVNPAPYFVTFGATRTPLPQPPESVKAIRFRELRFRQSRSIVANNCRVTVNDTVVSQDFSGITSGTKRYSMYTAGLTFVTSGTQVGSYLGFNASVPFGVGETDVVTMTNTELRYIGASGRTDEFEESGYRTGSYRRAYGLGYFATYDGAGTFPSTGTVYQGRLALSGIITDKSRIIISSVDPTEERYSFFQITDDLDNAPSDPFDVVVSGGDSADYIVGMTEWNNSLFALTRRSVYRISGGDQPLTAARRFVTYISNIGLVNPRCITRTDTAVYYLSDGGIFNLTPRVEDSEFSAIDKSLKVRDRFVGRNTKALETSASMHFDSRLRRLYVSLPLREDTTPYASDLYVLDTTRDSWTRYATYGRFRIQSIYEHVDNLSGKSDPVVTTERGTILLEYGNHYTDLTTQYTGSTSYNHAIQVGVAVQGVDGQQRYTVPDTIPFNSLRSVDDLRIYVGPSNSPTLRGYTKHADWIYLDTPTVTGDLVWFVVRSPINDSPQGLEHYGPGDLYPYTLWRGNEIVTAGSETLTFDTATRVATLTVSFGGLTTDVFHIGQHYLSGYVSGMFTQQVLGSIKRVTHAYLYFNNTPPDLPDTYSINDTIEQYVHRINANIAILFDSNDSSDATVNEDIYGFQDIIWDSAYYDEVESSSRQEAYALFKEPIIGVGYGIRLCVFSYDEARWNLVGYQLTTRNKGMRHVDVK